MPPTEAAHAAGRYWTEYANEDLRSVGIVAPPYPQKWKRTAPYFEPKVASLGDTFVSGPVALAPWPCQYATNADTPTSASRIGIDAQRVPLQVAGPGWHDPGSW